MNDEKPNDSRFLPDIFEHLENVKNDSSVNTSGNENLVDKIVGLTSIDKNSAKIILEAILTELRLQIIKGNSINVRGLGKIYLSSPSTSGNTKKVFVKFEPFRKFLRELNGK